MPEDTTPPVTETNDGNSTQENWESRYVGLQKVVAKRDIDLNTTKAELDALRAEKEALLNEVSDYRQSRVDAAEEEKALQQYEDLKARFEAPPPAPIPNGTMADWVTAASPSRAKLADDDTTGAGWPT